MADFLIECVTQAKESHYFYDSMIGKEKLKIKLFKITNYAVEKVAGLYINVADSEYWMEPVDQ